MTPQELKNSILQLAIQGKGARVSLVIRSL